MLACVAIVGKDNDPLFLKDLTQEDNDNNSLRFDYIVHSALDIFDETKLKKTKNTDTDMFLGYLCPIEEFRIYGYITNTQTKFVAIFEDGSLEKDSDIRSFFRSTHRLYVNYLASPFAKIGKPIQSAKFELGMEKNIKTCFKQEYEKNPIL